MGEVREAKEILQVSCYRPGEDPAGDWDWRNKRRGVDLPPFYLLPWEERLLGYQRCLLDLGAGIKQQVGKGS